MKKLSIATIGAGNRGTSMTHVLARMNDVEILYVCDEYEDRAEKMKKSVCKRHPNVQAITDYRVALEDEKVEAVFIFTAWESHISIAIEAMKKGKKVAMEVGGAYTVQDCFDLVKTSEETGIDCMMLENCCYGRYELMVKRLVEEGKFGTVVHCAGGYHHDLRDEIAYGEENRHYRLRNYLTRNCEQYPTHELGPIAKVLKINEGNRMVSLTSVASKACGLHEFVVREKKEELIPKTFAQGDVISTIIKCENGETIALTLDTSLPRFYSRAFTVQGTKGLYQEDGEILYFDGKGKHWIPEANFYHSARRKVRRYESSIWKRYRKERKKGGHGGIDYLVLRAFVEATLENRPYPIDVYDTAAWMVITPLSEKSIKENGTPQEIPDFTNGRYKTCVKNKDWKYSL